MTIYIGNISYTATKQDLEQLLAQFGQVIKVTIPKDYEKNRMKGYAFVELTDPIDEESAILALNKSQYMGRVLKVEKANNNSTKIFG